ncbi:TetR/AcrR family transcriptional regulator [Phenylobacterium immobile]|uniref:TetR/AcrR family transcriptional regulator n=1 Tax=Phenylobacterium immobile TaxID=21 RepID=UPI000A4EF8F1|nr:TetR/AcrR family transcriptional regulator [Phenylobacterium immobile]
MVKTTIKAAVARDPLTPERIIAAAIEMMDQDGVAALSMRRLGSRLSVQAMSLYNYFPSKEALLAAASSTLFATIQNPPAAKDPIDGLRDVMIAFHSLVEAHPSMVDLMSSGPSVQELVARGERDRAALVSAGFVDDAHLALGGLVAFTIGAVRQRRQATAEGRQIAFEYGLDMMLSGLRQEAHRRAGKSDAPV